MCSSADKPRIEFTERLNNLQADQLYFVIIRVWESGSSRAKIEQVTVQETPNSRDPKAGANPSPDGDDQDDAGALDEPKLDQFFMARMNIPLRAAEFHKHVPPEPIPLSTLQKNLSLSPGCRSGIPDPQSMAYLEAAKEFDPQGLTSQDLGAATAKPHPDAPGRQLMTFASLNVGVDKWTLLYKLSGKDFRIPVRSMSRILSIEMESADIKILEDAQLAEAVDPLKLDLTKPLKLKWTADSNLGELSSLTVQIGRSGDENSVFCVFPAASRSGLIEQKYLQGLNDGRHVIIAELTSHQIWMKYGWVVSTHDWRSGRLEK